MTNQLPTRTATREKIYEVIDGERDYQESLFPDSPKPSLSEFVALVDEYAVKLATPFVPSPFDSSPFVPAPFVPSPSDPVLTIDQEAARAKVAIKRFRQIAALAVRAMEVYGSIPRENHVPASAGITGEMHVTGNFDKLAPTAAPGVFHGANVILPGATAPAPAAVTIAALAAAPSPAQAPAAAPPAAPSPAPTVQAPAPAKQAQVQAPKLATHSQPPHVIPVAGRPPHSELPHPGGKK
jgi:hypothetical protein